MRTNKYLNCWRREIRRRSRRRRRKRRTKRSQGLWCQHQKNREIFHKHRFRRKKRKLRLQQEAARLSLVRLLVLQQLQLFPHPSPLLPKTTPSKRKVTKAHLLIRKNQPENLKNNKQTHCWKRINFKLKFYHSLSLVRIIWRFRIMWYLPTKMISTMNI